VKSDSARQDAGRGHTNAADLLFREVEVRKCIICGVNVPDNSRHCCTSPKSTALACSNSQGEDMNEDRDSHGITDWRNACKQMEERIEELEKTSHELGMVRATLLVNYGLNRPRHTDGIVVGHECSTLDAMVSALKQYHEKVVASDARLAAIRNAIEAIVIPDGEDAGVLLVSSESKTRTEPGVGVIYENEFFSDMGEALVALWKMTDVV